MGDEAIHNNMETYAKVFDDLDKRTFKYYNMEISAFHDALEKYPLNGKNVLIYGLAGCNCEAVWAGDSQVYVVDYNKPIWDHSKIAVLTHDELEQQQLQWNF